MNKKAKKLLRGLVPYGVVRLVERRSEMMANRERNFLRYKRIELASTACAAGHRLNPVDYESMIAYLVGRGLDEKQVRAGSMPESSLRYLAAHLEERLRGVSAPRLLHIGNFVGISLTYVT